MRPRTRSEELALLRDEIGQAIAGGCPETLRLPQRAWLLVHEMLQAAAAGQPEQASPESGPQLLAAAE
jgi:hypothetical protein